MTKSSLRLKALGFPLIVLGGLSICFIIVFQLILSRIPPLFAQKEIYMAESAGLKQKLAALTQLDQAAISQPEVAYVALPNTNPSSIVISQLKKIAAELSINLTSITVTTSNDQGETSYSVIETKATGESVSLLSLIKRLENLAPLVTVERSKIAFVSTSSYEMQLSVRTHWAAFPDKLPPLTQAISGLSDEELNILAQLASLEQPTFSQLAPSATSSGRVNPFSLEQ